MRNESSLGFKLFLANELIRLLREVNKITDELAIFGNFHLAVVSIDVPLQIGNLSKALVAFVASERIQMRVVVLSLLESAAHCQPTDFLWVF